MLRPAPACRLCIFISESDTWQGRPLAREIIRRAGQAGLAGASVFRASEGYGASARVHAPHALHLGHELPLQIIIVDAEQRIRAFLPELDEVIENGLVILDRVEVGGRYGRR